MLLHIPQEGGLPPVDTQATVQLHTCLGTRGRFCSLLCIPVLQNMAPEAPYPHSCLRHWTYHLCGLARALVPRTVDTIQACTLQNSGLRLFHSPWSHTSVITTVEVSQPDLVPKVTPLAMTFPLKEKAGPQQLSPQRPQQPLT